MRKARKPLSLLSLAVVFLVLAGACTARDVEKALYTGGKIAYDSFKVSNGTARP